MAKETQGQQKIKPQGLAMPLAALMYFDSVKPEKRKEMLAFDKLTEAEQDPFILPAYKFLVYLDKLNLAPGPKVDKVKKHAADQQEIDVLSDQIAEFVKNLNSTKPGMFPCRELAARILKGSEKV